MMLRVTDDDGLSTTLDEPIAITVKTGIGWVRTWAVDRGQDLAIDAEGNIYVCGCWAGQTTDFDPGPGEDIHSEPGYCTAFVLKYDSTGIYQWGKSWGSTGYYAITMAEDVSLNSSGNIFVSGTFNRICDFDPGPGEEIHTEDEGDSFISEFTSDGDFQQVIITDGLIRDVKVGPDDALLYSGQFSLIADLDPGPGVDNHEADGVDAFLVKLDADGSFL